MRFLKALQKTHGASDTAKTNRKKRAASNGTKAAAAEAMPAFLANGDLNIGSPASKIRKNEAPLYDGITGARLTEEPIEDPIVIAEPIQSHFQEVSVTADGVNPHLVAITQPVSIYCEEYKSLRTHVLHNSQLQKLQAIVISSVGVGEGKSVTALNLAWLMAQTDGIRALVIDGDLRMPSLASYLNVKPQYGLSDILDGNADLEKSIVRLNPSGLHLLAGGRARADVAEMISGPLFSRILSRARELFDYVIIDAPPLGIFTDATVLINHADGALLVVKANHANYKDVDRMLETLPRERMLGVVLNQSEDTLINGSYYDYSYYRND